MTAERARRDATDSTVAVATENPSPVPIKGPPALIYSRILSGPNLGCPGCQVTMATSYSNREVNGKGDGWMDGRKVLSLSFLNRIDNRVAVHLQPQH